MFENMGLPHNWYVCCGLDATVPVLGSATITFEVFEVSTILFEFSCTLPFNFSCTSAGFDNVSLLFSLPSSGDKALCVVSPSLCWWSGVNKTDAPGVLFCFAIESAFCSLGEKDTPRSPEIFQFLKNINWSKQFSPSQPL